jgi:hypothetical protein
MDVDNYKEMADRLETVATEAKQKWITTLAVGNGAALFAVFTLGIKDGVLLFPAATLFSGWFFLIGVIAASFAHLCSAASIHHLQLYWRWSSTEQIFERLGNMEEVEKLQPDLKQADEQGDLSDKCTMWASGVSSLAFVAGVAVPLAMITFRFLSA